MKTALKYAVLFVIGGAVYYGIELAWRGGSHWTMAVVGGICFIFCGLINERLNWDYPLLLQGIIGSLFITGAELISGIILNIRLGLHIWDYSGLPFNFLGQICLPFSLLWVALAIVAVILDDYLRYFLFGEEKPHYKFLCNDGRRKRGSIF